MNLPIELAVIFGMILFTTVWYLTAFISKKIKLWRYKPENDKGRLAEESRKRKLGDVERTSSIERRSVFSPSITPEVRRDEPNNVEAVRKVRKLVLRRRS